MLWFASTCILNGVAFTVFPSFVAGYLGSKSANTIRRNAIFLPMYSLLLLVPVMLGMAALFVVPNLDTNDLALLSMVTRELPGWVVGHHRRRGRVRARSSRWPSSCSASARCGARA